MHRSRVFRYSFFGILMLARSVCAALFLTVLSAIGAEEGDEAPRSSHIWNSFVETNFPFFSSVLDARKLGNRLPSDNLTPRGIILNLGNDVWACFDTDLLRMSAVWIGKGVSPISMSQGSYHTAGVKAPEGQEKLPQIVGTALFANGIYPGWQATTALVLEDPRPAGHDPREIGRGSIPAEMGKFKAIQLVGNGARLDYEIGGTSVSEWNESRVEAGERVIQRRIRLEKAPKPLWLIIGKRPTGQSELRFTVSAPASLEEIDGLVKVRVPRSTRRTEFVVTVTTGQRHPPPLRVGVDRAPTPRWNSAPIITRGTLSSSNESFVVDSIPLPLDNPWKRNVRIADIAFFKDGRAAAVTFDGDVWIISGLSGELKNVEWRRFASGLHEPLSLCSRDDELFVNDRNGIWKLGNPKRHAEARVHELFSNSYTQTAETREFATGIRAMPDGSFIIAKGGQEGSTLGEHNGAVLEISRDGKTSSVLGWGLRMPFIGVNSKTGLITASDQQGNYVPATPIHIIRDHQFYGFLPASLPKEKYPAPIADPLTWIPHPINPSSVSELWLTGAQMGPLNDAFIHLGYYRPEIFLVLTNQRTPRLQAAVVSITRDLDFPLLNGAVNPVDHQLYVTGFQIWGTVAKEISGLARLRYTGRPSTLPREIVPMDKGVLLKFDVALDSKRATNAANFSVERWNYRRTAAYGSPHFKLDGGRGQEAMPTSSAYLSKNRKSIFVGIGDMKPVMQMRIGWSLARENGTAFDQNAFFTPYEFAHFDPAKEGFVSGEVDLSARILQSAAPTPVTIEEGQRLSQLMGCAACHSTDGSTLGKVGPSWKGMFGSQRSFVDGTRAIADENYVRESIRTPTAKVVKGFEKSDAGMPSYEGVINDAQIDALILYIKSLR